MASPSMVTVTMSNRRGFLRALGVRAARDAREVAQAAGPLLGAASPTGVVRAALTMQEASEPSIALAPPSSQDGVPTEPPAPTYCADERDLCSMVEDEGLGARRGQISALARRSIRLSAAAGTREGARAWVDWRAAEALTSEPPVDDRDSTVMLAQLDLSAPELADLAPGSDGWLVLFAERVSADDLAVQATILDEPAVLPTMQPVEMAAHLALPRVWNEVVEQLELDDDEHSAYVRARDRLAALQGIDPEPGGGAGKAYHRLFGYPDETTGAMPGACVAAAGPGDWHLLAQLTTLTGRRVYAWAADRQLQRLVGFIR